MAKDHGPTVKNDRQYEKLREKGASKQKAARIANSPTKSTSRRGGQHGKYEDWSKEDLQKQARKVGIDGRSKMTKSELAKALRNS